MTLSTGGLSDLNQKRAASREVPPRGQGIGYQTTEQHAAMMRERNRETFNRKAAAKRGWERRRNAGSGTA